MVNTEKFIRWIKDHGYKRKFIASKMGLSANGLRFKINGLREFTGSEIRVLMDLGMTDKEVKSIILEKK
jgi:hypothetical protein